MIRGAALGILGPTPIRASRLHNVGDGVDHGPSRRLSGPSGESGVNVRIGAVREAVEGVSTRTLNIVAQVLPVNRLAEIVGDVTGVRSDRRDGVAKFLIGQAPRSRPIQDVAFHIEADSIPAGSLYPRWLE